MKVYPKTIIDDVKIDGAVHISDADRDRLIASIKSREFGPDEDGLEAAEGVMQGFWQDRGYFRVNVTTEETVLKSDPTSQHLALSFRVEEGLEYRLHDIRFRNEADTPLEFPPEQLRQLIPLKGGEIFSAKAIRDGMEALMHLYSSRGYIDFVSTPDTEFDEASRTISVVMWLDPGREFRIGSMEFVGGHREAQELFKSEFQIGEIFNPSAVQEFFQKNATILPPGISLIDVDETRDQKDGTVELHFDFRDCPR